MTASDLAIDHRDSTGAHGFSALIETEINGEPSRMTLFDTGPDNLSLIRNVGAMQVPIHKIERIITSHWHADHTGGLLSFLRLRESSGSTTVAGTNTPCVVDVYPNRPFARGIAPGPHYDKVIARLPADPTFEEIASAGGVVEKHSEGHLVADSMVWVSGEIPRVTSFEKGLPGGKLFKPSVGWIDETEIIDERYAAIDVAGKGLILFSAQIIGGLHLAGDSMTPRIEPTIDWLSKSLRPSPTWIIPMHCTGFVAKVALEQAFGEGVVPAGVGVRVEVIGDQEHDKRLAPAVFDDEMVLLEP
ncbi:hypothetical protein D9757_000677 [Collybiopsis confluens]|uniref:Metallo-beta-lactamase domain-containing protein n=1 Tax=Collybiopsis confluens TaxID=2823264 RepID=A0A8H5I1L6_9AGAR|nr:hypothetical protein D9757_000677 [Collybiopsis confluens]